MNLLHSIEISEEKMNHHEYISENFQDIDEYEDADKLSILDEILEKGADVPDFDSSFVESLQLLILNRGKISPKQYIQLIRKNIQNI